MEDQNFPKNFCCPNCKSTKTVSEVIIKPDRDAGRIGPGFFASLEQMLIPILLPQAVVALTIPGIKVHYDICWECGTRYCTKIEKTTLSESAAPRN